MNPLADESAHPIVPATSASLFEWASVRTALLLTAIFVVAPLITGFLVPPAGWIPLLWLIAAVVWWCQREERPDLAQRVSAADLRRVLRRFGVAAMLLTAAIAVATPERLLDWPRERPAMWLSVLLAYPLLSVLPQEMIYRQFLFRRLRSFRRDDRWSVAASALAFGALHGIYQNALAIALTLVGGWFFADTYRRTRSLRLVWAEHALYGVLIFTIGLGDFFSNVRVSM